jgi:hypothetical protein
LTVSTTHRIQKKSSTKSINIEFSWLLTYSTALNRGKSTKKKRKNC